MKTRTQDFEKIISAAHTRITRGKGKGKDYAPSAYEIQEIIDKEVLRIDKENGKFEFVSMEYAIEKLSKAYAGDIEELLNNGNELQNSFATYEKIIP